MESLIKKYNFMTATRQQAEEFESELGRKTPKYEKTLNEEDMFRSFQIVRAAVCRPDFPGVKSGQFHFAFTVLKNVMIWSAKLVPLGRTSSLLRFHEFALDFLHDLIRQGPNSAQMMLIIQLFNGDWPHFFQFKEYYKFLRGEKLTQNLRFLMREFKSNEHGGDREMTIDYMQAMTDDLCGVLTFDQQVLQEHRTDFIELYFYMKFSFLTRPQNVLNRHQYFAKNISHMFNDNVFHNMSPDSYGPLLKRLAAIIGKMNLQTANVEKTLETLKDVLDKLLNGTKAHFQTLCVDVIDFVAIICEQKSGNPIHQLIQTVTASIPKHTELNSEMFAVMAKKTTDLLVNLEDHTLMSVPFANTVMTELIVPSLKSTPKHYRLLIDLIKACLIICQEHTASAAYTGIKKGGEMINWHEYSKDVEDILNIIKDSKLHGNQKVGSTYGSLCSALATQLKRDELGDALAQSMVEFCLGILKRKKSRLFKAANEIVQVIQLSGRRHKEVILSIYPVVQANLTDPTYPAEDANYLMVVLAQKGLVAFESVKLDRLEFASICKCMTTAARGNFFLPGKRQPSSVHFETLRVAGHPFIQMLNTQEKMLQAIILIREIVKLLNHQIERVREIANSHIGMLVPNNPRVMAPFFNQLLQAFADRETKTLLFPLSEIYPHNPKPLEKHFQIIFDMTATTEKQFALTILIQAAKVQSYLFTEEHVRDLVEETVGGSASYQTFFMMVLENLSKTSHELLISHVRRLLDIPANHLTQFAHFYFQTLKNVGVLSKDQSLADQIMDAMEKTIGGPEDQHITTYCLAAMKDLGMTYKPLLEKRKTTIQDLKNRSSIEGVKTMCTVILSGNDGKSGDVVTSELLKMKESIEMLEVRVTYTEQGLVLVNQRVDRRKKELREVKSDVKKQGQEMNEVKKSVKETKAQVEELDKKTLSHAPYWARDVSKLMNPEDILDWRLLASRLGYSNDDIRAWAQMSDPCMAMLNEWYATRKTREATFAVFNHLQEMDRSDAAAIVENAMKVTEKVVEDDSFEYPEPPDVFISYQWGVQNEVKLLKQHLEMAGFTCWMDIGQMGGGDKLFEKIDKGIRGAKVVISCVTEKYAKSPNCNREVNLSIGLGKPVIPLLMEKMSWPPPGSMGPVFSEYLFIRFFARQGEASGDKTYWPTAKFQELLMQLNYNGGRADQGKVDKMYANWWKPVAEVIKIEINPQSQTAASTQKQQQVESGGGFPDVFISYQWDKQKQIQLLYKRLTELGFTCWMDIYQMGGGDSLYDKIDKGVRGAKIVLSCVTSKYSVSANCKREVSLADSLKKPIVPLLLEKMTWPPSGPMSMVFTQLLYITFAKDESVQERWDGDKFEELLSKLGQHVSGVIREDGQEQPSQHNDNQYQQQQQHYQQQQYQQQQYHQQQYRQQQQQQPHYQRVAAAAVQEARSCGIL